MRNQQQIQNQKEEVKNMKINDQNEEVITQQYLSSIDLDSVFTQNKPTGKLYEYKSFSKRVELSLYFFISNVIDILIFILLPIPLILMGIYFILKGIVKLDMQFILRGLLHEIICSFFVYSILAVVYFPTENQNISFMQNDAILFYFIELLIVSYLKTCYSEKEKFEDVIKYIRDVDQYSSFSTFFPKSQIVDGTYCLDCKIQDTQQLQENLKEKMICEGYSKTILQYSYINSNMNEVNKLSYDVTHLSPAQLNKDISDSTPFFFLIGIIMIKFAVCFHYVFMHTTNLSNKQYLDLFVIIIFQSWITFHLYNLLGNDDIRRKYIFMNQANYFIDFRNIQYRSLGTLLDVTCPISLESWDNTRKFMLNLGNDFISKLELCYSFLLLYLIFVAFVCLSYYFELFWIFEKESVFLTHIVVIMSSFNFILLSLFFLIRFYEGNKFNDSFEQIDSSLVYLIDTVADLEALFDAHFSYNSQKKMMINLMQEDKSSIYGVLVKKIKLLSKYYIKNGVKFEGKKYSENEKRELRMKILMNAKLSLQKTQNSLNYDSENLKYRFLNLFEVNFNEIFFTLLFAFVTSLPVIVPKFKEMYEDKSV